MGQNVLRRHIVVVVVIRRGVFARNPQKYFVAPSRRNEIFRLRDRKLLAVCLYKADPNQVQIILRTIFNFISAL
jgi:hypothetical protein